MPMQGMNGWVNGWMKGKKGWTAEQTISWKEVLTVTYAVFKFLLGTQKTIKIIIGDSGAVSLISRSSTLTYLIWRNS